MDERNQLVIIFDGPDCPNILLTSKELRELHDSNKIIFIKRYEEKYKQWNK